MIFFSPRCLQATSGQFNPVFRSSSTRGSPRLGTAHISQPIFVESSATQACKPLTSAPARPPAGALRPSRAAPEVSSFTSTLSGHMTLLSAHWSLFCSIVAAKQIPSCSSTAKGSAGNLSVSFICCSKITDVYPQRVTTPPQGSH